MRLVYFEGGQARLWPVLLTPESASRIAARIMQARTVEAIHLVEATCS